MSEEFKPDTLSNELIDLLRDILHEKFQKNLTLHKLNIIAGPNKPF